MKPFLIAGLAIAITALAASACAGTTASPIVDGAISARARITGSVNRPDGSALGQVFVNAHLRDAVYQLGYTYVPGISDATGRFQTDIVRLPIAPVLGAVDTITVFLVASATNATSAGLGDRVVTDSVAVLVRFYPEGQVPTPASASVHLAVP